MGYIETKSFQLSTYVKGDKKSNNFALVLPGLLDTKDYRHMRDHVDFLAKQGFLALSFDPPGTWESPGDISLYSFTNYQKAADELIEYFGSRPTFVVGHSRGATLSIALAATNACVFAFAAIMPSHIRGDYLGKVNKEWKKTGYKISMRDAPPGDRKLVGRFELPYSFFKDQLKYDFTNNLKEMTKAKLFVFGNNDITATPERVQAIYDIAGEPKEICELNSDHNYRYNSSLILEVNQIIRKFLNNYETL